MLDEQEMEHLQRLFENLDPEQLEQFLHSNSLLQVELDETTKRKAEECNSACEKIREGKQQSPDDIIKMSEAGQYLRNHYIVVPLEEFCRTQADRAKTTVYCNDIYKAVDSACCQELLGLQKISEMSDERAKKMLQEKREKGYCEGDLWNLDATIAANLLPKMVKEFRDSTIGYPSDLTVEKWNEILSEIVWMLEEAVSINESIYETAYLNGKYRKQKVEEYNKRMERASALFGKYFMDLWW